MSKFMLKMNKVTFLNVIGITFLVYHTNLEGFTQFFAKSWLHSETVDKLCKKR